MTVKNDNCNQNCSRQTAPEEGAGNGRLASTARAMRRKDCELTVQEAWEVIRRTPNAVLGTADASGEPYAVPVTPMPLNGRIYIHGTPAAQSRKLVNLEQNPRVSLVWVGADPICEEAFTVRFVSAMVSGRARRVEDPDERTAVLRAYAAYFSPSVPEEKRLEMLERWGESVAVWEIEVESVSGKAKSRSPYFG